MSSEVRVRTIDLDGTLYGPAVRTYERLVTAINSCIDSGFVTVIETVLPYL